MERSTRGWGCPGPTSWVALVALLAMSALPVFGQTFGEITGVVSDSTGAAVPNATITLTNISTNAARTTVTTNAGDYAFPSVPPAFYNIRVEHPGFKTAESKNVEVQVQASVKLDFTLQVGQVSESVEVQASAVLLQAENAAVGTVIENASITELPLNGREYLNLVALTANANTLAPAAGQAQNRQGGDRANQAISTGGNRIFYDYYTLDGVNNTDYDFNTYVVLPSIDAIQEFKVQTGVYPAEFGHGATQVNVLTKSGGNLYHGSLFEFNRNVDYNALPYQFTAKKPVAAAFNWNDYGFELDGPVRIPKLFDGRNRLFFMSNFETLVQRQSSQAVFSVPQAPMWTGDFSAYPSTIYIPNSGGTPFPNNQIPASMIDPTSQKFLKYYVPAQLPGYVNNYTQNVQNPFNRSMFVIRMDFTESPKSQWSGRYSWCSEVQKSTNISITGFKVTTGCEQYMGSNTRTFTPNLVNEAHFGHTRFFNAIGTLSAFSNNVVSTLNIPNLVAGPPVQWGVPNVCFTGDGFACIGDNTDYPYQVSDNSTQIVDNLSWIKGKHTFKFGFEFDRQNFNSLGNQYLRGYFDFQPNVTWNPTTHQGGDAFAEFLLGQMYTTTTAFQNAVAYFERNVEAAYLDDTWKITPKLTLSLGLRYELTPPFKDTVGNLFEVVQPKGTIAAPNLGTSGEPYFVRQGNCSNAYTANPPVPFTWGSTPAVCSNGLLNDALDKTRYNDFAPRIGIAYSPDSKTVIRAAFGEFFVQDGGNSSYFDMARNLGVRLTLNANVGSATWATGSGSLTGMPSTFANAITPAGNGVGPSFPPPYAYSNAYEHNTSYTEQYLLNIQRQVGTSWAFELGYLGSQSHHLYGFQNTNEGIPSPTGSANSHFPWADYTTIQYVADGVNAVYNALSFKVTRRFSQGMSVLSNYTYSHSIDDSSGIRVQGYDTLFPQNDYCIKCERGNSSFDVRHRWITSILYELPVGKGKLVNITNPFVNAVIGGWQTGGTMTVSGGLPINLFLGVDNSLTNGGYDRPNYVGGSVNASPQTTNDYWNRSAFIESPVGTFGNVGRNTLWSPGIFTLDAEVHKSWYMPWSEHHSLILRIEGFNATNHPDFGSPNATILSGTTIPGAPVGAPRNGFGVITSTQVNMRQLQFGLKYTF